jgi:hypothetical protein
MYQNNLPVGMLFNAFKAYFAEKLAREVDGQRHRVTSTQKLTLTRQLLAKVGHLLVSVGIQLQKQQPLQHRHFLTR